MKAIQSTDEALSRLEQLCQANQIQDVELVRYIQQLAAENDQLKLTLHKLRTTIAQKGNTTSSMHSKLTDALRE